ncbi:hypothetical protein BDV95DRAFT_592887 [Massariosphaeria phaeospora]|uniref:Killer toxin Kp4 domain-containing protein n=1 Tax=Massariosphaeria phaeospora TaxID=100035 RepID=A0A7C8I8T5_9PLEO|nr:hypothetical protein BDV95DRAFT_592887 [Massariosphaeria phaeospora]
MKISIFLTTSLFSMLSVAKPTPNAEPSDTAALGSDFENHSVGKALGFKGGSFEDNPNEIQKRADSWKNIRFGDECLRCVHRETASAGLPNWSLKRSAIPTNLVTRWTMAAMGCASTCARVIVASLDGYSMSLAEIEWIAAIVSPDVDSDSE